MLFNNNCNLKHQVTWSQQEQQGWQEMQSNYIITSLQGQIVRLSCHVTSNIQQVFVPADLLEYNLIAFLASLAALADSMKLDASNYMQLLLKSKVRRPCRPPQK